MRVLHLSPHPDDEALGAIATLLQLRDAGHEIVNVVCGLGSDPALQEVRRAEVEEACRRARFTVAWEVGDADLVIAPADTDAHPAHAEVGRRALALGRPLWQWSLWSDLPQPTLYVPFDEARLAEARHVLAAHESQLARNDFDALLEARGVAARVLGAERVFGFGSAPPSPLPYAELLCERLPPDHQPAPPRLL